MGKKASNPPSKPSRREGQINNTRNINPPPPTNEKPPPPPAPPPKKK